MHRRTFERLKAQIEEYEESGETLRLQRLIAWTDRVRAKVGHRMRKHERMFSQ
jgi:hypothetical protein